MIGVLACEITSGLLPPTVNHHMRLANSCSSAPTASKYMDVVDSELWPIHFWMRFGGTFVSAACMAKPCRVPRLHAIGPSIFARSITRVTQRQAVAR